MLLTNMKKIWYNRQKYEFSQEAVKSEKGILMRSFFHRFIAWCTTAACCAVFFPISVCASDTTTQRTRCTTTQCILEAVSAETDTYLPLVAAEENSEDAAEILPNHGASATTEDLPAACDMREEGVVTSVKNQGLDGMCWAFATLGAAESNLLRKGVAETTEEELDLSEEQVGYYLYTPDPQPLSPTYYDAILQKNKGATGGNALHASFYLSTIGVEEESYLPYLGCITEHSEYQRYQSSYRMTSSELVMSVRTDSERDAIKSAIQENGSVYAAFYSNTQYYYDNGSSYAYYQKNKTYSNANHAILLVGWDDNYAKENFDPDQQPATDGAWLVKNSWGDERLDDGYFWLSYTDTSLGEYSIITFEPREDAGNIYYYDNAGYSTAYAFSAEANVFSAEEAETLSRVGFYQCSANGSNAKCTIQVYSLSENATDPTDGTLLQETTTMGSGFGYQEVTLSEPVSLRKGERFSVVLSIKIGNNYKQNGYLTIEEAYTGSAYSMQFSSQPGQSYALEDGEWKDTMTMSGQYGDLYNVNIHAIMEAKETELDTTQLEEVADYATTIGETELAEQAYALLEQVDSGAEIHQHTLDHTATLLLDTLSQDELVTYPDYAYSNLHLLWGDMNEDGDINVEDAVLCLTAYARDSASLPYGFLYRQLLSGDVDGTLDGITVEDAVAILNYYAKQAAALSADFPDRVRG